MNFHYKTVNGIDVSISCYCFNLSLCFSTQHWCIYFAVYGIVNVCVCLCFCFGCLVILRYTEYLWHWTTKPVITFFISPKSWINKLSIDLLFVKIGQYLVEIHLFENLESGFIEYIYGREFTKYLNGTWSLLNILMIFWKKSIILTHTIFSWLLLQIYLCNYEWCCGPGARLSKTFSTFNCQ